jgi:hypothetical protein
LHDVLNHVDERNEPVEGLRQRASLVRSDFADSHRRVDKGPDDLGESVEPFDRLGGWGRELQNKAVSFIVAETSRERTYCFATLLDLIQSNPLELLFDFPPSDSVRAIHRGGDPSNQARTKNEGHPSRTKCDEEPSRPERTNDREGVGVQGGNDGLDRVVEWGRELMKEDVRGLDGGRSNALDRGVRAGDVRRGTRSGLRGIERLWREEFRILEIYAYV